MVPPAPTCRVPASTKVEPWALAAVRVRVDWKCRFDVEAPTVVVHGPVWSVVPAVGPELPAEALTLMPAAVASRKASSTASV